MRADNTRPRLRITAAQDATTVEIRASEPVTGTRGAATMEVEFRRSGLDPVVVVADVTPGGTRIFVSVPAEFDTANTTGLSAQDQVIVGTGEIEDLAGNGNVRTTRTAG